MSSSGGNLKSQKQLESSRAFELAVQQSSKMFILSGLPADHHLANKMGLYVRQDGRGKIGGRYTYSKHSVDKEINLNDTHVWYNKTSWVLSIEEEKEIGCLTIGQCHRSVKSVAPSPEKIGKTTWAVCNVICKKTVREALELSTAMPYSEPDDDVPEDLKLFGDSDTDNASKDASKDNTAHCTNPGVKQNSSKHGKQSKDKVLGMDCARPSCENKNANLKCSKCKRTWYCSKACQTVIILSITSYLSSYLSSCLSHLIYHLIP
jgi:hypothetical protein